MVAESYVLRIKFSGKNPAHRKSENHQAVKKPNFNIYLQKNNAKISLEFASACFPESVFQTAIFCWKNKSARVGLKLTLKNTKQPSFM